jgi:hypothetical protein
MPTLGRNGRFANQLFQYLFLRICADQRGARLETPDWIGPQLYEISDPPPSTPGGAVIADYAITDPDLYLNTDRWIGDHVQFWGWFQYHTRHYRPHRGFIRRILTLRPGLKPLLDEAVAQLRAAGRPVVAVHLRRGDYGQAQFFRAPARWYSEWIRSLAPGLPDPIVYLCSEKPAELAGRFPGMQVLHAGLFPRLPAALAFVLDFHVMQQADALAIANSSYSFAAAMLNERADHFARPTLEGRRLEPFDPWDSPVLLPRRLAPGEQEELDAADLAGDLPAAIVAQA